MKDFYIQMCCEYFNILQGDVPAFIRDFYKRKYKEYRALCKAEC